MSSCPTAWSLGLRLPGAERAVRANCSRSTRGRLLPGDVIVLYTDGITEAMDAAGELFGDAALARVVDGQHRLDAGGHPRARAARGARPFVGDAEPHDDMTMVVIKVDERGCVSA